MLGDTKKICIWSSEDQECRDIIIKDAIRISMSLPAVFKPHRLYIKVNERRILKDKDIYYVDGGIICNLPV